MRRTASLLMPLASGACAAAASSGSTPPAGSAAPGSSNVTESSAASDAPTATAASASGSTGEAAAAGRFRVDVEVDAAHPVGPMARPWRYFGADEPNYATTESGQKLLAEIGALAPGEMYFRAHNLLTSGDGKPALKWGSTNAYSEPNGTPRYDWSLVDGIFDAGLRHGVKPLVEIGFMPEALSSRPTPYRHQWPKSLFTGWTYPPKDYAKWEELVYRWTQHCVERYGAREVSSWWWETWNEPNIGYWSGSPEEFMRLNDHAMAAVRRALPTAKVGGPHTAGDGGAFMDQFLDHALHGKNHATGERGTPLDYLAFHAKGKPEVKDGHVRMGIANQLRTIETAFTRFARYPELSNLPVIIGESDPEGCAACTGKEYDYRNGSVYASYTAAVFPRKLELAARHGIRLEGAVTWAFTFADQPYFAGFRQVASNGVPMAVFNVFRMFARLGQTKLPASSSGALPLANVIAHGVRDQPDVGVLASRDADRVTVLIWHYHDDATPGPEASVRVVTAGLPVSAKAARLAHYRVDDRHGNAYTTWLALGSPATLEPEQAAALARASVLTPFEGATANATVPIEAGRASVEFPIGRHAVSLLVFSDFGRLETSR
jgi:xylan 1,4-beta-xylosidase